jgi:hypothetical protein
MFKKGYILAGGQALPIKNGKQSVHFQTMPDDLQTQ